MVKCKVMEMIYEARTQRLAQLIKERFGGSQTRFAAAVALPIANVNARLYGTNIGERLARRIEETLNLPYLWLDGIDVGRRKKPRLTVPSTGLRTGSRAAEPKPKPKTQTKASTERRTTSDGRRKAPPERRVNGDRREANLHKAA